jgi:hypothetical protein
MTKFRISRSLRIGPIGCPIDYDTDFLALLIDLRGNHTAGTQCHKQNIASSILSLQELFH